MTHDATEKLCQFVEMTEHDYEVNNGFYAPPDCQCALIAKVRKDGLSAAREAVRDAQRKLPIDPLSDNWRTDVEHRLDIINVIDALMEEQ